MTGEQDGGDFRNRVKRPNRLLTYSCSGIASCPGETLREIADHPGVSRCKCAALMTFNVLMVLFCTSFQNDTANRDA